MTSRKRRGSRRATRKPGKRVRPAKPAKTRNTPGRIEPKNHPTSPVPVAQSPNRIETQVPPRITIGTIRGDTIIGDLLVTFPRARDVLVREGLRLEAEDAGDIYMTLDVFSAMNGLKTDKLVLNIVEIIKEPVPQAPVPQLATTPAT